MKAKIVQITAGTGPAEARQFVALLGAHVCAWCERQAMSVGEIVVRGPESEPFSVEIQVTGDEVHLAHWTGTHVLVAKSDLRSKRSRKRWYAGVSVSDAEVASASPTVQLRSDDVTISAMRAGGPGGQNVNKTSTAVRVAHKATGITVRVSDERSQRENVRIALSRLGAVLARQAEEERGEKRAGLRLRHYRLERGRPAFVYELNRKGELTTCAKTCLK